MNPGDNLLEKAKGLISPELIQKLSSVVGESPDKTISALKAAVPTVMAGIVEKGSSESGAHDLIRLIREGGYHTQDSASLIQQLGSDQAPSLLDKGQSLLSSLFGSKVNSIIEAITNIAGVRKGSTVTLLGAAAPMVMSLVGKQASAQGFNPTALMKMLNSQKSSIASMLPAGLGALLGGGFSVDALSHLAREKVSQFGMKASSAGPTRSSAKFRRSQAWPWVVAGLIILVGIFLWQRRGGYESSEPGAQNARMQPPAPIPPHVVAQRPPAPPPPAAAAPDLGPSPEVIRHLSAFLANPQAGATPKTFVIQDLKFEPGSTRLTKPSVAVVNELADVLKSHQSAQVRLEGHTDSTGNTKSNVRLSKARADTIRSQLSKRGVDPKRIQTAGLGEAEPVADNNTPQGRLENRRVEIVITKR